MSKMINEKLLKQKLHEKSILENKILRASKENNYYTARVLIDDLYYLEKEIKEIQDL